MKRLKAAYICNIIIACIVLISVIWMMTGMFQFSGPQVFSATALAALKYYTVDSNIFMGLTALWMAIQQGKVLRGKKEEVPVYAYVLKLTGVAAVTLTMMVTVFFLVPQSAMPLSLFMYSNFFMHLFTPLLSIVEFCVMERTSKIRFGYSLWGISTALVYAIFYSMNVLTHLDNGQVVKIYDWYGFFMFGPQSIYIVIPIVLLILWIFSIVLWALNHKKAAKKAL